MKNIIGLLSGAVIVLCCIVSMQYTRIQKVKEESEIQLHNKDVLLGESAHRYKVADSLTALSTRELILTRDEFARYRTETAMVVSKLEADKRGLESISLMQSNTLYELRELNAKVVTDTIHVPGTDMRVIEYLDKWLDLHVNIYSDDTSDVCVSNREELIYTEWIKRRKFLWFRFGAKERRQEIISLNPNTEIISAEFITIKK